MKRKPLLFALLFLLIIAAAAFIALDSIGLALFDYVMGNNVYALQVSYVPSLDNFGNAKVQFGLNVLLARAPIETVLLGYQIRTDANASFADSNFSITLYVATTVANNIPVLQRTFTFTDGQARTIICYMQDYDSSKYPILSASITGYTVLDGLRVDFTGYGGQALVMVSWNFPQPITLTGMSFQGSAASWIESVPSPQTWAPSNHIIPLQISVPSGTANGNYTVNVMSQFSFQTGMQSIASTVNVQVGPAQNQDWFAWINANLPLITIAVIIVLVALIVIAWRRR